MGRKKVNRSSSERDADAAGRSPSDHADGREPVRPESGLCLRLDQLGDGAVLSTAVLAERMQVSEVTVKRMIGRGELPPPVPMGRWQVWTAGWVRGWIEMRLESSAQESQLVRKRLG